MGYFRRTRYERKKHTIKMIHDLSNFINSIQNKTHQVTAHRRKWIYSLQIRGNYNTSRQHKNDRLYYEYAWGNRRTKYIQKRTDDNILYILHEGNSLFHCMKGHSSLWLYYNNRLSRTVHIFTMEIILEILTVYNKRHIF